MGGQECELGGWAGRGPRAEAASVVSLGPQAPHRMGSERSWALEGAGAGVWEFGTPGDAPAPDLRRRRVGATWPVNFLMSARAAGPCQERGAPTQSTQHGARGPGKDLLPPGLPHCAALGCSSPPRQGPPGTPLTPLQGPEGPAPAGRAPEPQELKAPRNLGLCPRQSVFQINYTV